MGTPSKYTFSGHESFPCKPLWLKKGYDFIRNNGNFAATDAVVRLGVGKNMVASIRYWLRAFGLTVGDRLTEMAHWLFDDVAGFDPYLEDRGTLWLLHHQIVTNCVATLYNWCFIRLQRERISFERTHLLGLAKRLLAENGEQTVGKEKTITKDVAVLLQNYVVSNRLKGGEDRQNLLTDLHLLNGSEGETYQFCLDKRENVPDLILLFALLSVKGDRNLLDFGQIQHVAFVFCMNDLLLRERILALQHQYPHLISYTETAGMRQMAFLAPCSPRQVLNAYYLHETI